MKNTSGLTFIDILQTINRIEITEVLCKSFNNLVLQRQPSIYRVENIVICMIEESCTKCTPNKFYGGTYAYSLLFRHFANNTCMMLIITRKYTADEILDNLEVIKLTVNQLQYCLTHLEATITKRPISISQILSYFLLSTGKDRVPMRSGLNYAKSLLLTTKKLRSFAKERGLKVTNVSFKDIGLNYHYLVHECKMSQDDLELLPVILLHHPAALRNHWRKLIEETEPTVLRDLYKTPERLLNLLQYYLEKSTNFRHMYVLKDQSPSNTSDEFSDNVDT